MKWGRELALALAVGLAGTAWYLSVAHDQQELEIREQALFPGFDAARVRTIIAENAKRDWRVRIDRDERGGWRLVDPSALPANYWRVDHLLQLQPRRHLRRQELGLPAGLIARARKKR